MARERLFFEVEHVAHRARQIDRLALRRAWACELEEVGEQAFEPLYFGLDDAHAALHRLARRVLADAVRDGGFPPLMLEPIDFAALYIQQAQAQGIEGGQIGMDIGHA